MPLFMPSPSAAAGPVSAPDSPTFSSSARAGAASSPSVAAAIHHVRTGALLKGPADFFESIASPSALFRAMGIDRLWRTLMGAPPIRCAHPRRRANDQRFFAAAFLRAAFLAAGLPTDRPDFFAAGLRAGLRAADLRAG